MAVAAADRVIGDRYLVEEPIGRGGMGQVDLAYDLRCNQRVALKRVRAGFPPRLGHARLRREARLAAPLRHRAVVPVLDLVDDGGDEVALVTRFVLGPSLEDLHDLGPVAAAEGVRLGLALAGGLACIHEHGIVHLDLKLENVLLAPDGQPVIIDFGIARAPRAPGGDGGRARRTTDEHVIEGTPRVMSPEQIAGLELDARSDLFSLGVLLYELLSGDTPFGTCCHAQTLARALCHQQVALADLGLGIAPPLSRLVDQLLEKDPDARPGSAAEVIVALRAVTAP